MVARNPYVIGVPLTDDAAFYGRREIFSFIKEVLDADKQNVIVLYGQRRIGKTSVLYNGGRWLEGQGGFFPVYYDLQGKERLTLGQVLENLAQTLARRLQLDRPESNQFDEDGRYFADRFLPLAIERLGERRLVLLIDEFDVLGDELHASRPAAETLFPYLQELIASRRQVGFVFVVGRRIEELATHFQAIFKQAAFRRVGLLRSEDSQTLIVEPARGLVSYTDAAVAEIQSLAAGHPYFTQLICFQTFNDVKAAGGTTVTDGAVRDAVSRAIESGHGALNWFWEGLPRAERFILSAVAHVSDGSGIAAKEDLRHLLESHRIHLSGLELKDAPDRLVDWEMLRRQGPEAYQFVVELVRRWVIQEHPLSSARRDIDYVSKRAVRLFENAREAHSAGDLPYARDEYRRTLDANPNHSGAQLGLAQVLYELGDVDDAITQFERAHAIDEMSARDGLLRARLVRAKGLEKKKPDSALREYEQALALVPGNEIARQRLSALWLAKGETAIAKDNFEQTRSAFGEAIKYDVQADSAIHATIAAHADTLAKRGDLDRGADAYALLVELFPDRVAAKNEAAAYWTRCGDVHQERAEYDDAVRFYTRVLQAVPDDPAATARLDVTRKRLEEQQTVRTVFEDSLVAHYAGRFDAARDGWKKLIQLDVLSYEGHNIATLLSEAIQGHAPKEPGETDTPRRSPPPPLSEPVRKPEPARDDPASRPRPKRPIRDPLPGAKAEEAPAKPQEPSAARKETVPAAPAPAEVSREPVSAPSTTSSLFANSEQNGAPKRLRWPRRVAITTVVVFGVAAYLLFTWPASVTGVSMDSAVKLQPGQTFTLHPTLTYSSDWRDRNEYAYSNSAFEWSSSDNSVAAVDSGTIKAVGPGSASVTATYSSGSNRFAAITDVTVVPWDIPAMAGNVAALAFFSEVKKAQGGADVTYGTEFELKQDTILWAVLSVDVDEETVNRSPSAVLTFILSGSDGALVLSDTWTLWKERQGPNVSFFMRLPAYLKAGRYVLKTDHQGRVISEGTVTIR